MSTTFLIKGAAVSGDIKERLKQEVQSLGFSPCLAIILVGNDEESQHYVRLKEKAVAAIGGECTVLNLPADTSLAELLEKIEVLNQAPGVHGILVQLPLPGVLAEAQEKVLAAIDIGKDVDGFHPFNRGLLFTERPKLASCAALACLEFIERYTEVKGLRALLIGDSFDLIQPLALMLLAQGSRVEVIPAVHGWEASAREADLLVVEKGSPQMVTAAHIKAGAFIIDAGFHWQSGQVYGNVDTASVTGRAGWLAPVPGGIGPVLIAKLLENLVIAARLAKDV